MHPCPAQSQLNLSSSFCSTSYFPALNLRGKFSSCRAACEDEKLRNHLFEPWLKRPSAFWNAIAYLETNMSLCFHNCGAFFCLENCTALWGRLFLASKTNPWFGHLVIQIKDKAQKWENETMADTPWWLIQGFPTNGPVSAALILKVVLRSFSGGPGSQNIGACKVGTIFPTLRQYLPLPPSSSLECTVKVFWCHSTCDNETECRSRYENPTSSL